MLSVNKVQDFQKYIQNLSKCSIAHIMNFMTYIDCYGFCLLCHVQLHIYEHCEHNSHLL